MGRWKVTIAFAVIYFVWGSTYLAIRYALETIPPFLMMGIRSVAAGAILYAWSRRQKEQIRKEQVVPLVVIAILFFLSGHGLLAWAMLHVPSGIAALLIASEPLWIALIESIAIPSSRITLRQGAGLVCGFVGFALLMAPAGNGASVSVIPATAVILSALSWSSGAVYSRVARLPGSSTLAAGSELMIGGTFLLLVACVLGEPALVLKNGVTIRSVVSLGYLIVFGSIVAFTAYVWLLRVTDATRVATHTFVNPVIAVCLGWLVAQEVLTLRVLAASAVIVFSVYLVLQKRTARRKECDFDKYYTKCVKAE